MPTSHQHWWLPEIEPSDLAQQSSPNANLLEPHCALAQSIWTIQWNSSCSAEWCGKQLLGTAKHPPLGVSDERHWPARSPSSSGSNTGDLAASPGPFPPGLLAWSRRLFASHCELSRSNPGTRVHSSDCDLAGIASRHRQMTHSLGEKVAVSLRLLMVAHSLSQQATDTTGELDQRTRDRSVSIIICWITEECQIQNLSVPVNTIQRFDWAQNRWAQLWKPDWAIVKQ